MNTAKHVRGVQDTHPPVTEGVPECPPLQNRVNLEASEHISPVNDFQKVPANQASFEVNKINLRKKYKRQMALSAIKLSPGESDFKTEVLKGDSLEVLSASSQESAKVTRSESLTEEGAVASTRVQECSSRVQ